MCLGYLAVDGRAVIHSITQSTRHVSFPARTPSDFFFLARSEKWVARTHLMLCRGRTLYIVRALVQRLTRDCALDCAVDYGGAKSRGWPCPKLISKLSSLALAPVHPLKSGPIFLE